jgi:thiamine-phosphate pyrophosphorylase
MMFQLPKIYPITDKKLSGLSHADQVARLIDGGAILIQLRDKESSPRAFIKEASAALATARRQNVKLIINDRVDIAMAIEADGVHLGQTDLPPDAARKLLKPDSIIGVSTHGLSQVQTALSSAVDYIAFGPIFSTFSKSDHEPVVGLEQLSQVKRIVGEKPLVAIGGISAERVAEVLKAGADAVALISAFASEPSKIEQKMRNLLDLSS